MAEELIGDEEIHSSIAVQVRGDDAQAATVAVDDASLGRHIDKTTRVVPEEMIRSRRPCDERTAIEVRGACVIAAEPGIIEVPGCVMTNVKGQGRRRRLNQPSRPTWANFDRHPSRHC